MADCESCKSKNQQAEDVPYIVHEAELARAERSFKRLWAAIILLIVLLFGSNAGWLYYESQFEEAATTIEAEADDGGNTVANNNGMVNYNGKG